MKPVAKHFGVYSLLLKYDLVKKTTLKDFKNQKRERKRNIKFVKWKLFPTFCH